MRPSVRAARAALLLPLLGACAHHVDQAGTLASLRQVRPDTKEVPVEQGLDQAVQSYRDFLKEAPDSKLAPEAMRRLADLKIEKEFWIQGDGKLVELPATRSHPEAPGSGPSAASERDLEQRAASQPGIPPANAAPQLALPGGMDGDPASAGPLEAIKLYDELLAKYPQYAFRDQVLYQKARAYDELGQTEEALRVMEQLVGENPRSRFADEVQFRRAERFFIARKYREAERSYAAIADGGSGSEDYELALYKLGWTVDKQQLYQEALPRFFALLDYKVKSGYDFDAKHTAAEQPRLQDTFQVVSLSFSNLGGPQAIRPYFATSGHRAYEDRVYRQLAEFYFAKLRYQDAATVYKSFVALYPFHEASPHFRML